MDKAQAQIVGAAVEGALREVATRFGLRLEFTGGSFDATGYRPRVELVEPDRARLDFEKYARMFGLPESATFGAEYVLRGRSFTVAGLRLKARAKPVLMRRDDGKLFIFPIESFGPSGDLVKVNG